MATTIQDALVDLRRRVAKLEQFYRDIFPGAVAQGCELIIAAALKPLEKRLAEIESKGVEYKGVWQASQDYRRGDLVTYDGSIFHANASTRAQPGSGKAWTLAVKRGKDGR